MDSDHDDLSHVFDRFPDRTEAIARLAEASESFRNLCGEYLLGLVALGQLKASKQADRETRIEEYQTILRSLEHEIETALETRKAGGDTSRHR
jgi:hypothetical protein